MTTLIIWVFTLSLCGASYPIGPYASKAHCERGRSEMSKSILGPQAVSKCVKVEVQGEKP